MNQYRTHSLIKMKIEFKQETFRERRHLLLSCSIYFVYLFVSRMSWYEHSNFATICVVPVLTSNIHSKSFRWQIYKSKTWESTQEKGKKTFLSMHNLHDFFYIYMLTCRPRFIKANFLKFKLTISKDLIAYLINRNNKQQIISWKIYHGV